MRLSSLSLLFAIAVVLSLVQGCATAPKAAAVNLRVLGGGKCQVLDKTFPCDDVVGALKEAGVAKAATIQVQLLPGFTVGEAARLLNTLTNKLTAAGFTGVSKTAVAISPNDS
jgi:hypothetical protein